MKSPKSPFKPIATSSNQANILSFFSADGIANRDRSTAKHRNNNNNNTAWNDVERSDFDRSTLANEDLTASLNDEENHPTKKRKIIVTYAKRTSKSTHVAINNADSLQSTETTTFQDLKDATPPSQHENAKYNGFPSLSQSTTGDVSSKARSKTQKTSKTLEQSFLDLGQKNFGRISCEGCGMMYNPGLIDDETVHQQFHKKFVDNSKCIDFPGWKDEKVLKRFSDKSRIIVIHKDDSLKQKSQKVRKILGIMNVELGYVESDQQQESTEMIFLYINGNKKAVGCVTAEVIEEGYPVIVSNHHNIAKESSSQEKPLSQEELDDIKLTNSVIRCSKQSQPAACGIHRIWIHSSERRKGIATRLLDTIRENLIYGCVISKDMCAFTQPTPDGKQFFAHYIGKEDFLVYTPLKNNTTSDTSSNNNNTNNDNATSAIIALEEKPLFRNGSNNNNNNNHNAIIGDGSQSSPSITSSSRSSAPSSSSSGLSSDGNSNTNHNHNNNHLNGGCTSLEDIFI